MLHPRARARFAGVGRRRCPLTTPAPLCPSRCFRSPGPEAWTSGTLLGPPAPAPRSYETRCLHPSAAGRCPSKYRHQACPARDDCGGGGRGAQARAPSRGPACWAVRGGGGGRGAGSRDTWSWAGEGRSRGDSSAEGAGGALAPRRAAGLNCRSGGRGVWGPGVGCALQPRRCAACGSPGPGATAVPAAAAINLRRRSPDGGRGRRCPAPSRGGKVERGGLGKASAGIVLAQWMAPRPAD